MKKKLVVGFALGLFMFNMVGMANAGLIGAYEIKVYSGAPTYGWLHLAEVIATQTGTGIDVALAINGATATSTSNSGPTSPPNHGPTSPSYAIDGIYPSDYPYIYHSGVEGYDVFLDIQLASSYELDSITIYGRDWQGFGELERDIYNVYIYDSSGNQLFAGLHADARPAAGGYVTLTLSNTPVPEPATMLLFGIGIAGLAATRLKRKKK